VLRAVTQRVSGDCCHTLTLPMHWYEVLIVSLARPELMNWFQQGEAMTGGAALAICTPGSSSMMSVKAELDKCADCVCELCS
jgi:hypothetical protein